MEVGVAGFSFFVPRGGLSRFLNVLKLLSGLKLLQCFVCIHNYIWGMTLSWLRGGGYSTSRCRLIFDFSSTAQLTFFHFFTMIMHDRTIDTPMFHHGNRM